jgi:hypothetical protein
MFKKSVQQRAAKKPARKVVGIRRTNSLLQKLHETQRTRRIHRCAFNEEAGSVCNLSSSVYCNRLTPRKTTTTTTKFTDLKTSLAEDPKKKTSSEDFACLLASPSFLGFGYFWLFLLPLVFFDLLTVACLQR